MTTTRRTPTPGQVGKTQNDATASEATKGSQITGPVAATITGPITGLVAALSVEQVADLFVIAGSEVEAIAQLDVSVASLHEVQRAKSLLRRVAPAKIRAALELRATALRGESA